MEADVEHDPDFLTLIRSVSFPDLNLIVRLAKKRNISNVSEFWEFFDFVGNTWKAKKSYESTSDWR